MAVIWKIIKMMCICETQQTLI